MLIKSVFLFFIAFAFVPSSSLDIVQAESSTSENSSKENARQKEQLISWTNALQAVSSIAYVILRPLIALAGLAMDNQLIYGSFMNLDVSLRGIRQIVRSFANYALGFVFLIGILMYNLSPSGKIGFGSFMKGISGPKDLITKTLVAGVLIQASWFILMAMVDISTVLTYSVGSIPTAIIGTTDTTGSDTRMLGMNTLLNLGDEGIQGDARVDQAIVSYRTTKKDKQESKNIAPCKVVKNKGTNEQVFIVGRAFDKLMINGKTSDMIPGYCSFLGSLVSFSEFTLTPNEKDFKIRIEKFSDDVQSASEDQLKKLVKGAIIFPVTKGTAVVEYDKEGNLLLDLGTEVSFGEGESARKYKSSSMGCEKVLGIVSPKKKADGNYHCLYNETDISISNIINKSKSMTGPFASLYSSVFQFADLSGYRNFGVRQKFIITIVNAGFAVLLVLPLVALALVLFARVAILWVAIAVSPFIVLIKVYKEVFPEKLLPGRLSFSELMKLLIAPVLISFAVSLSLIFMTTLKGTIGIKAEDAKLDTGAVLENRETLKEISGFDVEDDGSLGILGFIKIHLDNGLLNLSWIITMLFGLGVTRFLLFWAIKQTKIGQSIGGGLQKLGETTLKTMPIIPIRGKSVSLGSVMDAPGRIGGDMVRKLETRSNAHVDGLWGMRNDDEQTSPSAKDPVADEKVFKEKAQIFFTSPAPVPFESTFNVPSGDTQQFLSTYGRAKEYMEGYTFDTPEQGEDAKKRLEEQVGKIWEGLIASAGTVSDDPELENTEASKIKASFNAILKDKNMQSSKNLNDWLTKTIKIGTKTYQIKQQGNSEYALQITS